MKMEAPKESHHFSADRPLNNPLDDQLDRDKFSIALADSLANWKERDSLVIGLSGEWGSGKSTIKNFIIHHLGERATVVEFNPWQWSGQDKLLEAFLWQLGKTFGKADVSKNTKDLAKKWKALSSLIQFGTEITGWARQAALSLLTVSAVSTLLAKSWGASNTIIWLSYGLFVISLFFSIAGGVTDKLAKAFDNWADYKNKSLNELRSEIEQELAKLDKPIVVFMDDIDRLTSPEIKLIVQLVKANAQFPNLVYFLLFQKNIVTKALAEITSDNGNKYLRKIVQVELDVPVASDKQMRTILEKGLDNIIDFQNVKVKWDARYWQSIFLDDLWPHFTTLRDIKRFLGSFAFYYGLHVNKGVLEVNR